MAGKWIIEDTPAAGKWVIEDAPEVGADGMSDADIVSAIKKTSMGYKSANGFGSKLNDAIGQIPRQLGLTARYALEGGIGALGLATDPIARLAGIPTAQEAGSSLANLMQLPKPQGALEQTVGDASRMVAGSAGLLGAANKVANVTSGITKSALNAFAANPVAQLTSAAGSGLAGGYVKETGGNPAAQFAASLAGGIAAPAAAAVGKKLATSIANTATSLFNPKDMTAQVDITIDNALKDSGYKLADLPQNVRAQLRQDVSKAMKIGPIDNAAVARAADYASVGATPMRGNLTLNPVDITRQKNLSKLGANSTDPILNRLANIENANNSAFIEGLNKAGANTADDTYSAGQKIIRALDSRNAQAKSAIDSLYNQARDTQGRSAALDPSSFTNAANDALDNALLGGKLPGDVRNLLNKVAKGDMPLTVDVAEQFKTRIGDLQRASSDKAERMALGIVRKALDDTPLMAESSSALGQSSIDAFSQARGANRAWMNVVDKTPALAAVRDGVEPDKFVHQYIIGNGTNANVMDVFQLKNMVKENPEAMSAIRGQITSFLKQKALNNASDEVGNFSQSAYNNALKSVGDRKLSAFFDPKEIAQLKAIGRVASYDQVQPRGSAVNNSNTAGATLGVILDKLSGSRVLGKIPFAAQGIGSVSANINARRAANIPQSLVSPRPGESFQPPYAPMLMLPGLLSSP